MHIRNVGRAAAPWAAALQEQADNLPRGGAFFSASCFHLFGQHQDWWISLATGRVSVSITLRRLSSKHYHHLQVLVRPPQIHCSHRPQKRHKVENTSALQDASKQALDQQNSLLLKRYVCQIYSCHMGQWRSGCNADHCHKRQPHQYLNQDGNKWTSKTCNLDQEAVADAEVVADS